ncbi:MULTISPECIES: hypothetical protein [Lysobacter]|uniref:hypothetical protein n=1 Tax=Lysobacter TaxID=68 RepID=UPI0004D00BE9|nr:MULTISPECIES: hypothetical protein [Lysobacter]
MRYLKSLDDDQQAEADITRLYELVRTAEPDAAELRRLDAQIYAGLIASYSDEAYEIGTAVNAAQLLS